MDRSFIGGGRVPAVLGVVIVLAAPTTAGAAEPTEVAITVGIEGDTPRFSQPLTYGAPVKLTAQLPQGTEAAIAYWPRRDREDCETARKVLTGKLPPWGPRTGSKLPRRLAPADQDSLVTRLGVPGTAEPGKPVTYTFTVDGLMVGRRYCFKLHRTTFRPLDEAQRKELRAALTTALSEALKHRMQPELYSGKGCDDRDMRDIRGEPGIIKACMVAREFALADASLAALRVRHPDRGGVTSLDRVVADRLRESNVFRREADAFIQTAFSANARSGLWAKYLTDLLALRSGAKPELEAQLAPLAKLPSTLPPTDVALAAADVQLVTKAQQEVCARGPDTPACTLLGALKETIDVRGKLALPAAFPRFDEFAVEMTTVSQVDRDAAPLPTAEPAFNKRLPFYVSLDAGVAFVPFRPDRWGVAQYFGVNFYFTPVDRDERLRWGASRHRGRELAKRFSLTLGITTTGGAMRPEDGIDGVVGKQFLMVGGGVRVTNLLRFGAGVLLYRQASRNPAGGVTSILPAPFLGFSLDIDLFHYISKSIKGSL